jgi:hypothetical protein
MKQLLSRSNNLQFVNSNSLFLVMHTQSLAGLGRPYSSSFYQAQTWDSSFSPSLPPSFLVLEFEIRALRLMRQEVYHLSHASSPFHSGYFWGKILLFAMAGLAMIVLFTCFLTIAKMTLHPIFLLRWGSCKLFPMLASKHDPPNLSLWSSKNYRY